MEDRYMEGRYREASEALWQLLDDIDTLSDSMRPDKTPYYEAVMRLVERRHAMMTSDGHHLTLVD